MIDEKQIQEWVANKTITKKQADKMLLDVTTTKKERQSNNLILALSTIGSILLGIGAILFIASNWNVIPDVIKVAILAGATIGAYTLGYFFSYEWKNLPRVGSSLIFLGALLFGATIILTTQIYNINANDHIILLIWLLGVIPLVYALKSMPIAALTGILYYVWMFFFLAQSRSFNFSGESAIASIPYILLMSSCILFSLGALHYAKESLKGVARVYRLIALKVALVLLLIFTFPEMTRAMENVLRNLPSFAIILFSTLGIVALILAITNLFFNSPKKEQQIEGMVNLGVIALVALHFFFPEAPSLYGIIFNLMLAGIIALIIYMGYTKEDISVVNIGLFWVAVLIIVRYFDWFWDLLPRSAFFLVGGLILVLGGIALEKKRRELKKEFSE